MSDFDFQWSLVPATEDLHDFRRPGMILTVLQINGLVDPILYDLNRNFVLPGHHAMGNALAELRCEVPLVVSTTRAGSSPFGIELDDNVGNGLPTLGDLTMDFHNLGTLWTATVAGD